MTEETIDDVKQAYALLFKAHGAVVSERDALAVRVRELTELAERLKLEAQIHAQEARTANAIIAEIYQCVTGGTGEPGNWNGAEPVRRRVRELEAALQGFYRNSNRHDWPADIYDAATSALTTPESKP